MKKKMIVDPIYEQQQRFLNEIAEKFGVVCFRPDYHGEKGDKNTVLFYTKEDDAHNRLVDKQKARYTAGEAADQRKYHHAKIPPECVYRNHFWSFENSDANGAFSYDFSNFGKLDLRTSRWKEVLEGSIWLALARKYQGEYVASTGGYWALREADNFYNDLNREIIAAMKMLHGRAFLLDVNYHDEKRAKIVAGEESVYEEVLDQEIYNFAGTYCVPIQDPELEELVRNWNADGGLPKAVKDVEKITDRVEKIGGINLIWF